jgi:hypothetical protein
VLRDREEPRPCVGGKERRNALLGRLIRAAGEIAM